MMKAIFRTVATVTACLVSGFVQGQDVNPFMQACAIWGEYSAEDGLPYRATTFEQAHRSIWARFEVKGREQVVKCTFRDLADEVPELVSVEIDGTQMSSEDLFLLNLRIWNHFVPADHHG
ncbi:MAG TPA: hypothetical protein VGN60_00775 [Devosia sp.]|jgi:hypothetical protein|nr:hypothetical protein [Devosia sp.]